MENERNINYLREFFFSKYNGILAGSTIGIGFLSAHIFLFVVGVVAYGLGLMFIHDSPWFQNKVNAKYDEAEKIVKLQQMEDFKFRRVKFLSNLSSSRKAKYMELVNVGKAIEQATAEACNDPENCMGSRLCKIDELIWTYLKLLSIEQSLEVFLESERDDDLPSEMKNIESNLRAIADAITNLKKDPVTNANAIISRERLFNSYVANKEVLGKRLERVEQAKNNIEVVKAEQERLQQQVKLIRADAVATRNTDALTSRIDASVEHLDQTNKWLEEMNDFKDVVGDMPVSAGSRIGFGEESMPRYDNFESTAKSIRSKNRVTA